MLQVELGLKPYDSDSDDDNIKDGLEKSKAGAIYLKRLKN